MPQVLSGTALWYPLPRHLWARVRPTRRGAIFAVFRAVDSSGLRIGHAARNSSILRRLAQELLRRESTKVGIKAKRLKAGWGDAYLRKVLMA